MSRPSASALQSGHVTLGNGLRHHYVEAAGQGPTLVFLHGYTDSWRSFELLVPQLERDFRLLLLDQRGHGSTERSDRYAIWDFAADAAEFIETVAKEPVHLVGHSLGSIVAQRVASAHPDLVRSLVLIGAARSAANHSGLLDLRTELGALGASIPHDFVTTFQRGTTYKEIDPIHLDVFVRESLRLHPDTWRDTLDGLLTDRDVSSSPLLHPPALSLWGKQDSVFDEKAQIELARHLKHLTATHYIDVGHAPHWEIPNRAAEDIADFVTRVEERHRDARKEADHAAG